MPVSPATTDQFLSKKYSFEALQSLLLPKASWKPFPTLADRADWDALPDTVKKAQHAAGERALKAEWPHLMADVYLQFARNGNRVNYENPYFARRDILGTLVIAECIEGKGRYMDAIVNAIWGILEESSWCLPAHINAQKAGSGLPDTTEPVVDLFSAETGALLAWTLYLMGNSLDTVSPLVLPRMRREIQDRILMPCLVRDDFWWMGFGDRWVNNWNPWINSNWLACVLLVEDDAERRAASVFKILRSVDRFITPYPRDGGCDEGPGYWSRAGASLFDNLDTLYSASAGKIDVWDDPLVRDIGRYEYRAHIADDFYLNFADAAAVLSPDPVLVYSYGKAIQDQNMIDFGIWLVQRRKILEKGARTEKDIAPSLGRVLPALFNIKEFIGKSAKAPQVRDVYLPEIEVVVARDQAGKSDGLYLAAKGGHNNESHNHNDVGHFVVYRDGKPLLIDVGVETYTRKTFSPQRYEIWTMQSGYHSLPTVNGVLQSPGKEFAARDLHYEANDQKAAFSLDIAGAYPAEAGIKSWKRTVTLQRGKEIVLEDAYDLSAAPRELTLSLMTASKADVSKAGVVRLSAAPLANGLVSAAGQVEYDPAQFSVKAEEVAVTDGRLTSIWGTRVCRLVFTAKAPQARGAWKVTVK